MGKQETILDSLRVIYPAEQADKAFQAIKQIIDRFNVQPRFHGGFFSQKDVVLITYADTLLSENRAPLQVLHEFCSKHLKSSFSAIHLLPFFPYSSDDGFSVIDYYKVNPKLGNWLGIQDIGEDFDLMFDFVLNHISAQSTWFKSYLSQQPGFNDLAIEVDPDSDLSSVVRPRALPLLTTYTKKTGEKVHLWTTFSADQIDLNYQSIDVLLKMIEVFLFYVAKGARYLRMDAVAYLWKQVGTKCIHLPQTHAIVCLLRSILDQTVPEVMIVTETNVPHNENISYFGNGRDEAQMVYNFTLPPLLLHAFLSEDSRHFTSWANNLKTPSARTAFFNFTASHDGIGLTPLRGILSVAQINRLIQRVRQNGGLVSSKRNSDGSESAYELNITYLDALKSGLDQASQVNCFLASQAIQMVLPGVPGVYIHSLLGSHNWQAGVHKSGRARTINRERLPIIKVAAELSDPNSFRSKIFHRYRRLLQIRRDQPAFDPGANCKMLSLHKQVIAIERSNDKQQIHALTNICGRIVKPVSSEVPLPAQDLLTGRIIRPGELALMPFQSIWLTQP